jgi:hypothetical protein
VSRHHEDVVCGDVGFGHKLRENDRIGPALAVLVVGHNAACLVGNAGVVCRPFADIAECGVGEEARIEFLEDGLRQLDLVFAGYEVGDSQTEFGRCRLPLASLASNTNSFRPSRP